MFAAAPVSDVQALVEGLNTSGVCTKQLLHPFEEPESASTRPLGSKVAVGYQRLKAMSASRVHVFVDGSKALVSTKPPPLCTSVSPPIVMTRPSESNVCPAQKRLLATGTPWTNPVAGSSTRAAAPDSKYRIRDEPGNSTACCITFGRVTGLAHSPTVARGSTPVDTVADAWFEGGPTFPAASLAVTT